MVRHRRWSYVKDALHMRSPSGSGLFVQNCYKRLTLSGSIKILKIEKEDVGIQQIVNTEDKSHLIGNKHPKSTTFGALLRTFSELISNED